MRNVKSLFSPQHRDANIFIPKPMPLNTLMSEEPAELVLPQPSWPFCSPQHRDENVSIDVALILGYFNPWRAVTDEIKHIMQAMITEGERVWKTVPTSLRPVSLLHQWFTHFGDQWKAWGTSELQTLPVPRPSGSFREFLALKSLRNCTWTYGWKLLWPD